MDGASPREQSTKFPFSMHLERMHAPRTNSFPFPCTNLQTVNDCESEEDGRGHECPIEKLRLTHPKKLLVFDLGGVLCHRVNSGFAASIPKSRAFDAAFGVFLVYKRPYCEDFMRFCLENFEVAIWSSAKERIVNDALDCVMGELKRKLLFVWAQDQCTHTGFKTWEKKDKPIFLKNMSKLRGDKHSITPWGKGRYSPKNTLLIDDSPYKALLNPPYTAVFPIEYTAEHVNNNALGPNGILRRYLDGLTDADDVTAYVKKHPFGQPAITATHPDWDNYSGIIDMAKNGQLD